MPIVGRPAAASGVPCQATSGTGAGGSKPWPSCSSVSARKRASCAVFATPPWTRYANASATHARRGRRGLVQHGVRRGLAGEGDQRRAGGQAARAQRREALPGGGAPQQPHDHGVRALQQHRRVARDRVAGTQHEPFGQVRRRPRRGRHLGVGGGKQHERWHCRATLADARRHPDTRSTPTTRASRNCRGPAPAALSGGWSGRPAVSYRPVVMVGSPAGTPCSRSRWTAAMSRCAATRSPSRSRRAARTSA